MGSFMSQRWFRRLAMAAVIGALTSGARAAECEDVPRFIGMYGTWESVAVHSEPAAILVEHPEWTTVHEIVGTPTEVCPGIVFKVVQESDAGNIETMLTYVYDASTSSSFGVVSVSNGARLRAEIQHNHDRDYLTMTDFDGNVVWREMKVWISDDEFRSEGTFDFHGEEGRVFFRTYRVTAEEKPL